MSDLCLPNSKPNNKLIIFYKWVKKIIEMLTFCFEFYLNQGMFSPTLQFYDITTTQLVSCNLDPGKNFLWWRNNTNTQISDTPLPRLTAEVWIRALKLLSKMHSYFILYGCIIQTDTDIRYYHSSKTSEFNSPQPTETSVTEKPMKDFVQWLKYARSRFAV